MAIYKDQFFSSRDEATRYAASTILDIVLESMPPVVSAVDVGCGVGTWLACLRDTRGVTDLKGYDGPWVSPEHLVIPAASFEQRDLSNEIKSSRRYDLAISLEVAEHVPESSAATFVRSLINLSDFVLFSAAIPFQGGRGHVNEQWPDYWVRRFDEHGYVPVDLVRRRIWQDDKIPSWYKQNILLFVRKNRLADMTLPPGVGADLALPMVHPDTYLKKMRDPWKLLRKALKQSIRGH